MRAPDRRPALTLLEMIVVMGIIAVLAGLVMAVIMISRQKGPDFQTTTEIRTLANGAESFKIKYGMYPTSQLRLCEQLSDYKPATNELDRRSLAVLNQMFGQEMWNAAPFIDWDGNGAVSGPVILTGDQCLVFFLGGVPEQLTPGTRGFGTGKNPTATRGRPFFSFKSDRLVKVRGNNFYSYLDPYGKQPYAYFSADKWGYQSWTTLKPLGAHASDCPNLGGVDVDPYRTAANEFHMPRHFQIISAGKDGVFGPGGAILRLSQGDGAALPAAAQDDLTNFSGTILGGY